MSRHFSALVALLLIFSMTGCNTTTNTQSELSIPKQTCSNSPVLIADLTKPHPLTNTQLPNGSSCAGENA